jgi:hypothetical protein
MADVLVILGTIGFFLACTGYVALCERIVVGESAGTGRDGD